ncbi:MAG: alkylhydroperoxidase family enzyme [Hyphomicrobiaceae bacterium]|jgi:alkylhydroperoxidase family enzyme
MKALQDVEWLEPLVEQHANPELDLWIDKHASSDMPHTPYLADCAWMLRADVYLDESYSRITDIAPLIYMAVSRDNSCRFCYGAVRFLMRIQGMSEKEIEGLERDIDTAAIEPRIKLALDFSRRVSRSNPPPGAADKQALRDVGYDDTGIKEIAFQAADVIFHNRMATLLALPLGFSDVLNEKGMLATLREQFGRLLAQISTPAKTEMLTPEMKTGPYSAVVNELDGIIQARMLRMIIDEAWASPNLPTKTKALIFAVIARGLGSKGCEQEAYRLLELEGLSCECVDTILAHLSGPELDPAEILILPYVRETIWYQAPSAQRRGRDLGERLSNKQFLETVGIAALANMVCRLELVLDVD